MFQAVDAQLDAACRTRLDDPVLLWRCEFLDLARLGARRIS
ncbi:hypothetical protein RLEG12_25465 [Rhizobium leguminosarum bv. trifolii CB782]|nr:hypothetical protein RLEG12_25465 [Rhizobium leguminosarum bv. trifolii CB782]